MDMNIKMNWTLILCYLICIVPLSSAYFNYYVYAQQWPASFCFEDGRNEENKCDLASNITMWTNHGLWPSVNESYPSYCNNSWHLSLSDILPLVDDMRARWPSFAGKDFPFWDHEWTKHGTCAAVNPNLRGPFKFFDDVLQLNKQYNLQRLYSLYNINPDENKCYNYTDVVKASKQLFSESVVLGCTWDSHAKKQHIAQIEICFDKDFKLTCNPSTRGDAQAVGSIKGMPEVTPCRPTEPICYTPIHIQHSHLDNMQH